MASGSDSTLTVVDCLGSGVVDFANPNQLIQGCSDARERAVVADRSGSYFVGSPSKDVIAGVCTLFIGQYRISELRGGCKHAFDEGDCYYDVKLVVKYPTISGYDEAVGSCVPSYDAGALLLAYATGGAILPAAQAAFIIGVRLCLIASIGEVGRKFDLKLEVDKVRFVNWSYH